MQWLLILVLLPPTGPNMIVVPVPSEVICNERAKAAHDAAPVLPMVFKCVDLNKLLGEAI